MMHRAYTHKMHITTIYEGAYPFFSLTYLPNVDLALPILDNGGRWLFKHDFLARQLALVGRPSALMREKEEIEIRSTGLKWYVCEYVRTMKKELIIKL